MSLIVRLPLNNNATNFGCDEITTSGTPTFVENISKTCSGSLYTNSKALTLDVPSIAGKKEYSFAFWVKRNGGQGNWFDIFSIKLSDDSLFRLETHGSSMYASVFANNSLTNDSGVNLFGPGATFDNDVWYHVAVTVSLDYICTYLNGNLRTKYKYTPTYTPKEVKSTVKIGDSNINVYINDFRIYDHPLSSTEVRKISDGMIVDYEFDEPNGNILKNTDTFKGWDLQSGSLDNTHQLNGHSSGKIEISGLTSNGYNAVLNVVLNKSSTTNIADDPCLNELIKPGDVITCSMWVYLPLDHGIDNGVERRIYQSSNSGGSTDWTGLNGYGVEGKWVLLKRTYTIREDLGQAVFNVNVVRNGKYWVSSPKIEFGKDATVWTNKPSTFKDDNYFYNEAEYMTQGDPLTYHSVSGNIYKSSDTNIGFGSIVISNPNDTTSTQLTTDNFSYFNKNKTDYVGVPFSLEVVYKRTSECYDNGTFINLAGYGNKGLKFVNNKLTLYDTSTDGVIADTPRADLYTVNNWAHYVLTYDGYTIKQYLNGELKNAMTIPANNQLSSLCYYYSIGYLKVNESSYRSFNGKISRLRFYTTALSADRITSLYKTSMSVDNKGNIFGTFFENDKDENEVGKISFNKTHVIEAMIDEDTDVANIKFKKTKEILAKSFQEY